jgi:3-polyprenyl-4-hydroxybenzoate decarboxylase
LETDFEIEQAEAVADRVSAGERGRTVSGSAACRHLGQGVYLPPGGCSNLAYARIKTHGAHAKQALGILLTGSRQWMAKIAYVFDEDVDIYSDERAKWAIARRYNPEAWTMIMRSQTLSSCSRKRQQTSWKAIMSACLVWMRWLAPRFSTRHTDPDDVLRRDGGRNCLRDRSRARRRST